MTTPVDPTPAPVPSTPSSSPILTPILAQIEQAGIEELEALKPEIGKVVRSFAKAYEDKLSGVTGMIERRVIDSIIDAIFGPATS